MNMAEEKVDAILNKFLLAILFAKENHKPSVNEATRKAKRELMKLIKEKQ